MYIINESMNPRCR